MPGSVCSWTLAKLLRTLKPSSRVGWKDFIKQDNHCSLVFHRASTNSSMSRAVETYVPPAWTRTLSYIPKKRVQLAQANTPVHRWMIPGVPSEFSVSIKRDDLTGSAMSGNKVRKLEFLMADALDQGCRHVITFSALQSNHCRAVAVAARELGLKPHLFLKTKEMDTRSAGFEGNVLLDRLCGSDIYLVPWYNNYETHMKLRMERLAQHIKSVSGEDSYLIPVGGSNKVGLFGYITVFEEMRQQGVLEEFDDLVFACGSGGTADGLVIGNYLTGEKLRIHAIAVSDNADHFYDHCNKMLAEVGLGHMKAEQLVRLVKGHKGKGHGVSTPEGLDFIQQVATQTGIFLDPAYSGKAAQGMVQELQKNPGEFKGRRVLYLHTGGIFGLFDGRMSLHMGQNSEQQSQIQMWPEVDVDPFQNKE